MIWNMLLKEFIDNFFLLFISNLKSWLFSKLAAVNRSRLHGISLKILTIILLFKQSWLTEMMFLIFNDIGRLFLLVYAKLINAINVEHWPNNLRLRLWHNFIALLSMIDLVL